MTPSQRVPGHNIPYISRRPSKVTEVPATTRARGLAILVLTVAIFWQTPAQASGPVTACAIRWDAWYTNGSSDPGHYTAATLSPLRWHRLAPVHAHFDSSGQITWASSPETFDAEIRAAHTANLCWAYVMYGKNHIIDLSDPLMRGLVFHRASAIKTDTKYALMMATSLIGQAGQYEAAARAAVDLMADANYQHVTIDGAPQPLLFLIYDPVDLKNSFKGSLDRMKEAVDSIRRISGERKLGNPYIVLVFSPANDAERIRGALGADAISQYVSGNRKGGIQSWADFEPSIEADWDIYTAATTAAVIPTLRSGADIRARCQIPPPFDHRFIQGACNSYVESPTIEELKSEFQDAVTWLRKHRDRNPASLLVVYSWSECDESGNCLMPTIGDPTGQKLKAISAILDVPHF